MKKHFILLLVLLSSAIQGAQWEEELHFLSFRERFYLTKFFKHSIQNDQFGFTIFFDKPVSLGGYCIRWRNDEMTHPYRNKLVAQGWNVWKKHAPSFPHPNFIFCEDQKEFYDPELNDTFKVRHIYLINKLAFLKLLKEQTDVFVSYLGTSFSPEALLADIEESQTFMPHINHNRVLLGVCLGYGLESAQQFERHDSESVPFEDAFYQPISSYQPDGCPITPVVFAGNPHSPQVQNIQQHYAEPIMHVWRIYQDPAFLQIILNKLCTTQ